MAAAEHSGAGPDLYQLLGVPRQASREQIVQAWRRRARDEHPDARPSDEGAPGRFRVLAHAWQVLGDPARRAAYDRALADRTLADRGQADRAQAGTLADRTMARGRPPTARLRVTVRHPARAGGVTPGGQAAPPLRVGPVWVEGPRPASPPHGPHPVSPPYGWDEEDVRLVMVALRRLGRDWGWPW